MLEGFDLNVVLVQKDSEYMKFKEEIKDKSHIRQVLGDVSDSVMQQLERWWDKYAISLIEIDSKIKESEAIMHDLLKELEYE